MQESRPKFCYWSRQCLLLGFVLATLTAAILYAVLPLQYPATATLLIPATATLLIPAERQQFLFEVPQPRHHYELFVNTQMALLRSPAVLDKALEAPEITRLPIILKQRDKRGWLMSKLRVRRENGSEVISVSIKTDDANASEKIVNAVVDTFLRYTSDKERKLVNVLIQELISEKRRQQAMAQTFQDNIRVQTKQIACPTQGESLQRDVDLAKSKLVALKAQHLATQNLIEKPSNIPVEVLAHMNNSRFAELNEKRARLQQERDDLVRNTTATHHHPHIQLKDREIVLVDEEIAKMTSTDDNGSNAMLEWMRIQEQVNLFSIDREIRVQEVYLEELEKKHKEQLVNNAERSEGAADVEFMKTQLDRIDKTLNQIDERILASQTESRRPGQIVHLTAAVPSMPNPMRQIVAAGAGFLMVFFAVLFLGIVLDCFRVLGLCRKQLNRAPCCPAEESSEPAA